MKQATMLLNPEVVVIFVQLKNGDYKVTFPKKKGFKHNTTTLEKAYFEKHYKIVQGEI
jgi:hypothetical protein